MTVLLATKYPVNIFGCKLMRLIAVDERNLLAQLNEKLVHKVVHRMSQVCREPYEDLYQLGYIGLIKAPIALIPAQEMLLALSLSPIFKGKFNIFSVTNGNQ